MSRLARLRLVSVGHAQARMEDLHLDLRDAAGRATDSTLWLRNGGGKSSILNLFFALVRPDRREFLGGKAEAKKRRLEDYVLSDDRSVVACEWELDGARAELELGDEPVRLLTGVFYEWRSGSSADDTKLRRLFFAARVAPEDPRLTLEELPLFVEAAEARTHRRTLASFRQEWLALRTAHPHLDVFQTENQREWSDHLDAAGIDPELFAYQIRMNQREGGVNELLRFDEHEQFVDFLLELALDPALGERVSRNIATFRRELKERKDRLLPERELLSGLAARLVPLGELGVERAALGARAAETAHALAALRRFLEARVAQLGVEAAEHDAQRLSEAANAESARANAATRTRRAAALRRWIAERRHLEAAEKLAHTRRELDEASELLQVWEAAVPLRNALKFENQAEGLRLDLERKQAEHTPVLEELKRVARDYASALSYEKSKLRREEIATSKSEKTARDDARSARNSATTSATAAARAESEAARLSGLLRESAGERARLEALGALAANETGAAAATRLLSEIQDHEARGRELVDKAGERRGRVQVLQEEKSKARAAAAEAAAHAHSAERRLDEALSLRRLLEENAVLRKFLELEVIELERLSDQALVRLHEAAKRAIDEMVRLKMERAEDDRAVVRLEETGLLPPTRDAERVIDLLKMQLPAAWSGWSYLEANTPPGALERRRQVEAHPELALGVVVRDTDFDKAREIARAAECVPETPIVVAPQRAFDERPPRDCFVVGPASDAYFDRTAAQTELLRRRARLDTVDSSIRLHESHRKDAEELAGRLREFRHTYPRGWFGEQSQLIDRQQRASESAALRARELGDEIQGVERELSEIQSEQANVARRLSDAHTRHALIEQFVRQHESQQAARERALAAARAEREERARDVTRWNESADAFDTQAAESAASTRRLGEEARAREEELRRVDYLEDAIAEAPGPVDEWRDRYHQLKSNYEERVGAEGLLQLRRMAETNARDERRKLAAKLNDVVDEARARAALAGLEDPSQADARRDTAVRIQASARGAHGNQTQVETRTSDELADHRRRCAELGDVLELPPLEIPTGGVEAEAEAKAFDDGARQAEIEAGLRATRSAQAEKSRDDAIRSAQVLGKDREQLETISVSYEIAVSVPAHEASLARFAASMSDDAVGPALRGLEIELKQIKTEAARLDLERQKAVRSVRAFASDAKFEALQSKIGRQFSLAEESDLEAQALEWRGQLELRAQTIDGQLAEMNQHRDILVTEALAAAEDGLALLRSASSQSRLPEHVPGLGGAQFLRIISHAPDEIGERRGRIGELIDELVDAGGMPSGMALVQRAVRRLARPVRVKVLNPDPDLGGAAVDITDMARFSGGEQLTGAILLYCTLAQLRARARGMHRKPASVLILDNPIGRASRVRFLELQRDVARAMGVQLFYTTAVNDHEALRTLPNVIRLRNQRFDRNRGHRVVETERADAETSVESVRVVRAEIARDGSAPIAANGSEETSAE